MEIEKYVVTPEHIINLEDINLSQKFILSFFFGLKTNGKKIFCSNEYLASLLKIDERNIRNHLQILEQKKYIQRVSPRTNREIVVLYSPNQNPIKKEDLGRTKSSGGEDENVRPVGRNHPTYNLVDKLDKKTKEKNIKKRKVENVQKNSKPKMTIADLKENNPLQIPDTMLEDYVETRKAKKAPITKTSWQRLHTELHKCIDNNINPIEAFEEMVTNGWLSIKANWLINQNKKNEQSKGLNWDDTSWADGLFKVEDGKLKVVDDFMIDEESPLWK